MSETRLVPGAELQALTDRLIGTTGASRTTIRLDTAYAPAVLMAESLAAGVRSMRTGPQPEIVAAATYVFLARERRILVQSDTREPPAPPPTLLSEYRVLAQLLAPVLIAGQLVGTVSVHQQDRVRTWTSAEVEALSGVQREVESWYLAHRSDRSGQRPVPAGWRPHRPRT